MTQRRRPYDPRYKNANEAWKAQWGNRVAWSTMFAVAAHAAAVAFWPAWDPSDDWLESDLELLGTAWIALYAPPSTGAGLGGAPPALALLVEPDSLPSEAEVGMADGETALALVGGSQRLRDRLASLGGPVPTIVQFNAPSGPPGIGNDPGDSRESIEDEEAVDPEAEDLALLPEASPLDLSRLSALRPEIVLPGTSAWILIRNPEEVVRYMGGITSGEDSEAEGQVDVAVWIDEWGSVEWAELTRSSGREDIDELALALFNEVASFSPARDQGVRVSISAIFTVLIPW